MLWCCQDGSCLPCFAQFSSVSPFNNCIFLHLQWGTWVICRLWLPRAALEQQAAQGNPSFFCGDRLNLPTTTRWRIILSLGPWLWSTNRGLGFELRKCLIFEGLNNCQHVVQVALCYWIWSYFAEMTHLFLQEDARRICCNPSWNATVMKPRMSRCLID